MDAPCIHALLGWGCSRACSKAAEPAPGCAQRGGDTASPALLLLCPRALLSSTGHRQQQEEPRAVCGGSGFLSCSPAVAEGHGLSSPPRKTMERKALIPGVMDTLLLQGVPMEGTGGSVICFYPLLTAGNFLLWELLRLLCRFYLCSSAVVVRGTPLISSPGSVPWAGNGKSRAGLSSGTSSPGTGAAIVLSWHHTAPRSVPAGCRVPSTALLCHSNVPCQQRRCLRAAGAAAVPPGGGDAIGH